MADHASLLYMRRALALAEKGRFFVSPNPMVGCVIVKNNKIIAEDWHRAFGQAHAEINALKKAGAHAKGSTVYVTLEPCCHHGKTPPCTDALIKAGVKKIYIATLDPNPRVYKKSLLQLKKAGIKIFKGLCQKEAQALNRIFFYYMQHQRPFVMAKWAMSWDGKTITSPSDDRAISSSLSLQHVHQTRRTVDAILVGANTFIHDNPALTARNPQNKPLKKQPLRIILWGKSKPTLSLNRIKNHRLLSGTIPGKTWIITTEKKEIFYKSLSFTLPSSVEIIKMPKDNKNNIDLVYLLNFLGKNHIAFLLVEGGQATLGHFFHKQLVNHIQVYLAPVIISTLAKKKLLKNPSSYALGPDRFFEADI